MTDKPRRHPRNLVRRDLQQQINLTWTASTDNVGVVSYQVESCSGASCGNFGIIGTPTTTSSTYRTDGIDCLSLSAFFAKDCGNSSATPASLMPTNVDKHRPAPN